jgi:hypothetical protein
MRIGVTINVGSSSIWSAGVNQNAMYLAMLLKEAGHDTVILYSNATEANNTKRVLDEINTGVQLMDLKSSLSNQFDVIIQLGLTVEKYMHDEWKKQNENLKFVCYECGNHFLIDQEKVLYEMHNANVEHRPMNYAIPDQVWCIPQMENTNLSYFKFKRKCNNTTVVPFIWDPIVLETEAKNNSYTLYKPREIKKLAVMEPNISVMKNCLFPIIILDKFVEEEYAELEKIYLVGAKRIKDNLAFKKFITPTRLLAKKLLTAESRIQTHFLLNNYADLVLSWQWENNLNYLYFDVAWLGWPVVHNANLCQDIGYYYESFDAEDGALKVKEAIENHNDDVEYMERMRKTIGRYTKENKKLREQYNELLEDLVNDRFRKRNYTWQTNTID